MAAAEKVRALIAGHQVGEQALKVTASFGISALSIVGKDIETLLAQADAAMYKAKQYRPQPLRLLEFAAGGADGGDAAAGAKSGLDRLQRPALDHRLHRPIARQRQRRPVGFPIPPAFPPNSCCRSRARVSRPGAG